MGYRPGITGSRRGLTFTSASSQITFTRKKRTSGTLQVPINELFSSTFIPVRVYSLITQVVSRTQTCQIKFRAMYGLKSSKTLS